MAHKHGCQIFAIKYELCFTIINDILLGNINDHENNIDLVFAKIPS